MWNNVVPLYVTINNTSVQKTQTVKKIWNLNQTEPQNRLNWTVTKNSSSNQTVLETFKPLKQEIVKPIKARTKPNC